SQSSDTAVEQTLDFDSVQRANPELQRRAQELVSRCWQLGEANPIIAIHDVGAGGLSNAFPELVHDANRGAVFDLTRVPVGDSDLSPAEIWSNEAQERYVLAISPADLDRFEAIARRERCPYAIVGVATVERQLRVTQGKGWPGQAGMDAVSAHQETAPVEASGIDPVDLPLDMLLDRKSVV